MITEQISRAVKKLDEVEGIHPKCKYFVLDPLHDENALLALKLYVKLIEKDRPELYADLNGWLEGLNQ